MIVKSFVFIAVSVATAMADHCGDRGGYMGPGINRYSSDFLPRPSGIFPTQLVPTPNGGPFASTPTFPNSACMSPLLRNRIRPGGLYGSGMGGSSLSGGCRPSVYGSEVSPMGICGGGRPELGGMYGGCSSGFFGDGGCETGIYGGGARMGSGVYGGGIRGGIGSEFGLGARLGGGFRSGYGSSAETLGGYGSRVLPSAY